MIDKIKMDNPLIYQGWTITEVDSCLFKAYNDDVGILFEAEYDNGLCYKIKSIHTKKNDRVYTAWRYHLKYYSAVCDISFELLKNNYLWDYQNNQTALKSYKKDITPYYNECKRLGLSFYDDVAFIEDLFK